VTNDERMEVMDAAIKKFFEDTPEEEQAGCAEQLVFLVLNYGSHDHYQALGICHEALLSFREASLHVLAEEEGDECLEK